MTWARAVRAEGVRGGLGQGHANLEHQGGEHGLFEQRGREVVRDGHPSGNGWGELQDRFQSQELILEAAGPQLLGQKGAVERSDAAKVD